MLAPLWYHYQEVSCLSNTSLIDIHTHIHILNTRLVPTLISYNIIFLSITTSSLHSHKNRRTKEKHALFKHRKIIKNYKISDI